MAPKSSEPVLFQDKGLDFKDKEVWLVQVPPDFDASRAVVKSDQEVVYEGASYSLLTNGAQLPECNILAAPDNGSTLKLTPAKPRGVLTLTKKVSLPKVDYDKVREPKPAVPQKENLRMRHYPTGYGPSSFGIDEAGAARKRSGLDHEDGSEPAAALEPKKRKSSSKESSSHEKKHKDKKSKDKKSKKEKKTDSEK